MRRLPLYVAGWVLILVAASPLLQAQAAPGKQGQAQGAPATSVSSQRALLDRYCVTCHNQRQKTAGLLLDTADLANVSGNTAVWEKVIRKIRLGAMPPPGLPRPVQADYDALASYLEGSIDRAAAASPNPGRTDAVHRLNRIEYRNAVRDVIGVDVNVSAFLPPDDSDENGFDNTAEVLSLSPALLDRYLAAARKLTRLAVGRQPSVPLADTYNVPILLAQDRERVSEDLPFGSRGGTAFRHYFPVDGDYDLKITLQKNYTDYVRGLREEQPLEVRIDGVRIKVFTVGGGARGLRPAAPSYEGSTGNEGDPKWEAYLLEGDKGLEVRFPAKAGLRTVGVAFVKKHREPEGVLQRRLAAYALAQNGLYADPAAVETVTIRGPYNAMGPGDTPARRGIFVCRPVRSVDEEPCARKILSGLGRRAYRRPVTPHDIQTLLEFYKLGRRDADFEGGIQFALERLLVDPDFLFRIERDPSGIARGTAYRISDLELASRLSFFLWSSIPDDELLDLAARGKLKDQTVLVQQVRRMLADARSTALVENFAAQWLELRQLGSVNPDSLLHPEFDENLRQGFRRETELFLGSVLREDRSVMDLLSANYTFVNERLAKHYGIPNVFGDRFRRVELATEQRGGLLGHGSLLMLTSYPNRTSPVLRGKWLLSNILGTPPPPPPPDVPGLPEKGEGGKPASVRERLEQHRKNPVCAVCHSQMDPLGFALENFDPIGHWRTTDEGQKPIDASGTLLDGRKFEGMVGLRTLLLTRREQFVGTVVEKLLGYSVGRTVTEADRPMVREIMRKSASTDYRWSSIILGVVQSVPFQMRRSQS